MHLCWHGLIFAVNQSTFANGKYASANCLNVIKSSISYIPYIILIGLRFAVRPISV